MFVSQASPKPSILIGSVVRFKTHNSGHKVSPVFPGNVGVVVSESYDPKGNRRWMVYHPDINWVNKVTVWDSDALMPEPLDKLDPKGYFSRPRWHTTKPPPKAAVNDNF